MKSKVKNYKKKKYSKKGGKPTRLEQAEKSRRDMSEYYKQMDNSMKEKIDIILNNIEIIDESHELVIWDIGTGTGNLLLELYKTLKSIYPNLNLYMIGIDLMETSIITAIENANKNDITQRALTEERIVFAISNATMIKKRHNFKRANYIIYSSIIHEIYSYTETTDTNYVCSEIKRIQSVEKALEQAHKILKPNGKVLIRDFIRPDNANEIVNVAFKKSEYETICSIFEKFIDDHRTQSRHYFLFTLVYPSCKTLTCENDEYLIYETNIQTLYEFLYRKDYLQNWDVELNERYGFWNESGISSILTTAGFKIDKLEKYHNSWIMKNRLKNIYVYDKSGYIGIPYYQTLVVATKQ
jgi:ubiquinone/menaquinone biosynthesis C-methylase UbiE